MIISGRGRVGGRPQARLLAMMRPPESSSPPQTPHGSSRSSAPWRHDSLSGQSPHIAFARAMSMMLSEKNSPTIVPWPSAHRATGAFWPGRRSSPGGLSGSNVSMRPARRSKVGESSSAVMSWSLLVIGLVSGLVVRLVVGLTVIGLRVIGSSTSGWLGPMSLGRSGAVVGVMSCLSVAFGSDGLIWEKQKAAGFSEPGGLRRGDLTMVLRQNSVGVAGHISLGGGRR